MGMNSVSIVGRLTRDPELRYTPNGVAVANFTLAINRPFRNQQGEQDADFINCVAWRKPAENLANYMRKGSRVGAEGRLQSRTYEGQDGKTVFVTEVVADRVSFLDSPNENQQSQQGGFNNQQQQGQPQNQGGYQNQNQQQGQGGFQNQQQQGNQPQGQPQQQQGGQSQQGQPFQQQDGGGGIEISDDDLPF